MWEVPPWTLPPPPTPAPPLMWKAPPQGRIRQAGPEYEGVPRALGLPTLLEVSAMFGVLLVRVVCTLPVKNFIGSSLYESTPLLYSDSPKSDALPSFSLPYKPLHSLSSL